MNNELWSYVQKLKTGNLQVADLNGCVSTNTNFLLKEVFNDKDKKRSIWASMDDRFLSW
ncbi:hypothetical protein [Saccharibacillus qingshengii]|uniref:hypothetical protein n=1 Tax=Saccharibacillus qingshengii TaxID=1763540 RepID=UPI001556AB61|nr:hypothetical protein [Saccharibacillus qingshengii]